ncbi:MAG: hypothetical protein RMI01_07440 [Thermodesulfovibrio sp.]|nr:hypothetical protein [Thermodesulfovibrio sp.]
MPEEYILKSQSEKEENFLELGRFGPIMPPIEREVEIVIEKPLDIGSILNVKGMTKSGPFYHLAGKDDILSDIKP